MKFKLCDIFTFKIKSVFCELLQWTKHFTYYTQSDLRDLHKVRIEQKEARREEVYDNIASVVLGTERFTDDELPFMEAVEAKYNALRKLLFSHVLELEHGVSWHRCVIVI